MAKAKQPKTIYFLAGIEPTATELEDAERFMPGVVFRVASKVAPDSPIEPFDAVAGMIPDAYANSDGKPAPSLRKWEKRQLSRQAATADEDKPAAKPDRRSKAPVAAQIPSIDDPTPQGGPWGAAPVAPAPAPAPARAVWKPNA
jgi:hypothetical protein